MHFCSSAGVTFQTDNLGIRAGAYQISVHVCSSYIEELQRDNKLQLEELNEYLNQMKEKAKQRSREYIRHRMQESAHDFIDELKREDLYPYREPSKSITEDAERQVFDIVALQINESLPSFSDQDWKSKQLTFALIKEALDNDTSGLQNILTEVINLPKTKVEELSDILERTTLATMIDTFKVIIDRLRIIDELRLLIFDDKYRDVVLERKHFHQIVKNETWIFGDEYALGIEDSNLKNVLKKYLADLGREDFEEIVEHGDNSKLCDIPDICLWKQFPLNQAGFHRNLVLELKRPNKIITTKEIGQIKKYAFAVAKDSRFPKDKTEWIFILLASEIDDDVQIECNQMHRKFGHIHQAEGINIYVFPWGNVLNEAEARHQFLKDRINMNVGEGDGIELLKQKYASFLPKELVEEAISDQIQEENQELVAEEEKRELCQ